MQQQILCESAGWVLLSDGHRLVFANRGTAYRHILLFVLALLTLIFGINGGVWLVVGTWSGENLLLGIVLAAVAALTGFATRGVWKAEKRDMAAVPGHDRWVAVLDLEAQTLESPEGGYLAALSEVRFAPVLQIGSSSRALAAKWPGGSKVVYRGSPFAGSFRAALDALRHHGVGVD